jgi:precorrin-6A/cobalt-precorrin-6A reductase
VLAGLLAGRTSFSPVSSLAGATSSPKLPAGEVRVGGFGGVEGLKDFLREDSIDLVVDAAHPFAVRISEHAKAAAEARGIPLLRLARAPWTPQSGDCWHEFNSVQEAAESLPSGARVLLTLGSRDLAPFFAREDIFWVARMIEPPSPPVPSNASILLAPPAESAEEEAALLRAEAIDWLVSKNAGGHGAEAKLVAARALDLPVAMIARPVKPPATSVPTPEEMVEAVENLFGRQG